MLSEGGASFPKLNYFINRRNTYTGCCTVRANARIERDEELFFIPFEFIMTSDIAKASDIGQKIINSNVELRSKHTYLASYLLQEREKGPSSKWNVYIQTLPKTFENIPFNFTDAQKAQLIGSMTIKKMRDRYLSLKLEYDNLCANVPEYVRWSLQDFIWARLVVITRIFGFVIDDVKTDGLVPVADFLRHRRPRQTKWSYIQRKRGFAMTALRSIEKDEEVFVSFGRKCNSRFFVNYGFIVEGNPDNEALLTLHLPKESENVLEKARHLSLIDNRTYAALKDPDPEQKQDDNESEQNEAPTDRLARLQPEMLQKQFQIPMQCKETKVREAFSFLRVVHAEGNEFAMVTSADHLGETVFPLSIRNELRVLQSLSEAAQSALKQFTTSLEYDNELLLDEKSYPSPSNERNIVVMRKGEKQVLSFFVELHRVFAPLLQMDYQSLQEKVGDDEQLKALLNEKDSEGNDNGFKLYLNLVALPLVSRLNNQQ